MLFNSFEFPIFFAVVVSLYFSSPYRYRWLLLLLASYVFYAAWRPEYLLLILASTVVDYFVGLAMGRTAERAGRTKYLLFSLAANLGLLFTFKYFNFFSGTAEAALRLAGLDYLLPHLNVLLPVGISFYTFQTLSYTIEVYRGAQEPERHAGRFALYVAFFPQLVAGPIERAKRLLPQFSRDFDFDYDRVRSGLIMMLWGLFKKVVIADRLAVIVDFTYGDPGRCPGVLLVAATAFFAIQIYCDFSGYSDIAIGAARVMGYDLMKNFNRPFAATSIPEHWRRWHISLSTWFRDYVYIPLGGSRVSTAWWAANIMVVFTVSGLWHGASATFVIWGALHGAYYLAGRFTEGMRKAVVDAVGLGRLPRVHRALQIAITFSLVCLAFVFFRAGSLSEAVYVLTHLGQGWIDLEVYGGFSELIRSMDLSPRAFLLTSSLIVFLFLVEGVQGDDREFSALVESAPAWLRWGAYAVLSFAILNLGVVEETPFVYYQF